MSRWPSEPVAARWRVMRGEAARAWAGVRGRVARHVVYLHPDGAVAWPLGSHAGAGRPFHSFAAWCAAHRGADALLRVSGHAVHHLMIDAALGLGNGEAARRYARQQFTHYHGSAAATWPLAIWAHGVQRGVCGLHGLDMDALLSQAASHDVRITGLVPAWSAVLSSTAARVGALSAPGRHALLVVEGRTTTWVGVEDGVVSTVRQKWLDAPHPDELARVLGALIEELGPLATPPVVAGWGLQADATLPTGHATVVGTLAGADAMDELLGARTPS